MTNLPKADLNEAAGAADTAWVAEQQAAVAEVRLGHKEGGSCDPFTQEDAGRTPAAQLLRGHDRAYLQAVQQFAVHFGIIPVNRAMDTRFSSLDFAGI
jgi:hypothetical protein